MPHPVGGPGGEEKGVRVPGPHRQAVPHLVITVAVVVRRQGRAGGAEMVQRPGLDGRGAEPEGNQGQQTHDRQGTAGVVNQVTERGGAAAPQGEGPPGQGEAAAGIAQMRQALETHRSACHEILREYYQLLLVEQLGKAGQTGEALHLLGETLAWVRAAGAHRF